jgi:hypothetical protein
MCQNPFFLMPEPPFRSPWNNERLHNACQNNSSILSGLHHNATCLVLPEEGVTR